MSLAILLPLTAEAAYNASGEIGQLDHNGQPTYTHGNENSNLRDMGFQQNQGIVMDEINHQLYVSDSVANRVMVFDLDVSNNLVDRVADHVLGQINFDDFSSGLDAAHFNNPLGMAVDPVGQRLFVADAANYRVLVFDVSTIVDGESAVNVLGQPDFTTANPVTSQSTFKLPTGIEYDQSGQRLFVSDASSNRVLVFDMVTIGDGENAVNVLGQPDFITSTAGSALNQMSFPQDIAYDGVNDRLFVVNFNNGEIFVHDTSAIVDGQAALDKFGSSDLTFGGVGGEAIEYDSVNQRIYVSHTNKNRVLVYDVSTITTDENAVNVLGQPDFVSAVASVSQTELNGPERLFFQGSQNKLYVVDGINNRIVVFDVTSITDGEAEVDVIGQYTNGVPDFNTSDAYDSSPSAVGFGYPTSVALDANGHRLFVADYFNNRVLVFNLDSQNNPIDGAADFVLGQPNLTSGLSGLNNSSFSQPRGLSFDETTQRLYVTDSGNNRIMVFDVTTITNGEAAVNELGQIDFNSNITDLTQTNFFGPFDTALDIGGQRLFVLDNGNRRIMVFDVSTIADGEAAINVLGSTDFVSIAPFGTAINAINSGTGLAFNQDTKHLFVSDESDARVIIFDTNAITDGEDAVRVFGQPDFTTMGVNVTQDGLVGPYGMDIDTNANRLMIADSYASRVIYQDLTGMSDGQPASSLLGWDDYLSSGFLTTQDGFSSTQDIAYDPIGNKVFVADGGNARIMIFQYIDDTTPALPDGTVGIAYNQNFTSSGGQGVATININSGVVPTGLLIAGSNISGVPVAAGLFSFDTRSIDTFSFGTFFSRPKSFNLTINPPAGGGGGGGGGSPVGAGGPYGHPSSEGGVSTSVNEQTQTSAGEFDDVIVPPTNKCALRDVKGHRLEKVINKFYALNIVEGRQPCLFFPDANMNRAEAAKVSLLGFGHQVGQDISKDLFVDVGDGVFANERAKNGWYLPYLSTGKKANIVNGYSDGSFRPDRDITFEELVKLYGRAGVWSEKNMSTDFYWANAKQKKAVNFEDQPTDNVSRARALEILEKLLRK